MTIRTPTALLILILLAAPLTAQLTMQEKATLTLVADRTAYAPGEGVSLAAVMTIDKGWHVNSHTPSYEYLIPTELTLTMPAGIAAPALTYPAHKMQTFEFAQDEPIAVYDGETHILARFALPEDIQPGSHTVEAALRYQACDDRSCLPPVTTEETLTLTVGSGGEPAHAEIFAATTATATTANAAAPAAAGGNSGLGLGWVLLFAVIGGLILNAMPCVLPVLSLKVFGLVKSASLGRRHLVIGSLATTLGILASFWALAAVATLARAAGEAIGWGVQFQHPGFVTFLAVVVVLFSLNLWGLFEVPLPSALAQVGGQARQGVAGHFASGLFATLMATPCSAPFLGTAVGFALGQSAPVIFATFTAVGLGLALPYLLLAAFPRLANALPRPGAWMDTLKGVMGFLLAASAVWLFYVLAAQVSPARLALVQLALLALALFIWLQRRLSSQAGRRFAAAAVVATAVVSIVLAANAAPHQAGGVAASSHHQWIPFDEAEAEQLAATGSMVFVDVTADWCFTCKTNEQLILETNDIADAFAAHDVVTMKADWTNRNDEIAAYLARHGRSSIPFYALYRPGQPPHVFSELLTKGRIVDALSESAGAVATLNHE